MNPMIEWQENGQIQRARWRSEAALPPPPLALIEVIDGRITADEAYRCMAAGTALLWRGDWVSARHLLQALTQRADRQFAPKRGEQPSSPADAFAKHRQRQGGRASVLARFLVPVDGTYRLPLRRAQDIHQACEFAWGPADGESCVVSLRELLAVISAGEWRRKGVPVPAVQGRIYPHYGVFSPVRGEYVDLVAQAPLPAGADLAFDIGAGSGILAAILARRGVGKVVAIDQDPRALACAAENVEKLGLAAQVEVRAGDLFPAGRAPLIVCNPPWLPAQPSSPIEYAVYDPDSRMLRGFLLGLAEHLTPDGEGWLIISDIAELLGLRTREQLLAWIADAGLQVLGRLDTRPTHPKSYQAGDVLYAARSAEVTTLWRLGVNYLVRVNKLTPK